MILEISTIGEEEDFIQLDNDCVNVIISGRDIECTEHITDLFINSVDTEEAAIKHLVYNQQCYKLYNNVEYRHIDSPTYFKHCIKKIYDDIQERADYLSKNKIDNFYQIKYHTTLKERLVIIDEVDINMNKFDMPEYREVGDYLRNIMKLSRVVGYHIILTTSTGVLNIPIDVLDCVRLRVYTKDSLNTNKSHINIDVKEEIYSLEEKEILIHYEGSSEMYRILI